MLAEPRLSLPVAHETQQDLKGSEIVSKWVVEEKLLKATVHSQKEAQSAMGEKRKTER